MTMPLAQAYEQLSAIAWHTQEPLGVLWNKRKQADVMRRAAGTITRWAILQCNGVTGPDGHPKWDEDDQAKADKATERALERFTAALHECFPLSAPRLRLDVCRDPRGCPIVIDLADSPRSDAPIIRDRIALFE